MSGRVEDRWPVPLGGWVPLPVALLSHAAALGLSDGDLRLLATLESLRRADEARVVIGQQRLGELCGCSDRAVRRRIEHLRERGYLAAEPVPSEHGRWAATAYRLDGLWTALADASDRRTPASAGRERPQDESAGVRRTPASGVRRTPASDSLEDTKRKEKKGTSPSKNGRLTHSGDLSRFDRAGSSR